MSHREERASGDPRSSPRLGDCRASPRLEPFPFGQPVPRKPPNFGAPSDVERRPFWLVKVLYDTMATGAWLTESVYVPKVVWFQTGTTAMLPAVKAKMRFLEAFSELLANLEATRRDNFITLVEQLELFIRSTTALHQKWLRPQQPASAGDPRPLPATPERSGLPGALGKFWAAGTRMVGGGRKPQVSQEDAYVPLLMVVLFQMQFLAAWQETYEQRATTTPPQVLAHLKTIAALTYNVVCTFALKDLLLLYQHYMAAMRR
eukprot:EG_transcript_24967